MLEVIIVISFILHKSSDAYIVLSLLVFNAVIVVFQDRSSSKTVEGLKQKLHINVKTLRDGTWTTFPARELVPGDIYPAQDG